MIKKIILCLCFLFIFSGYMFSDTRPLRMEGSSLIVGTGLSKDFMDNSRYEMILWGGPITYSYYADAYVINGNFIVIDRYVEYGPYADSSIIRESRLMLPSGSTVIKSRTK
jgi:hypothetical protein